MTKRKAAVASSSPPSTTNRGGEGEGLTAAGHKKQKSPSYTHKFTRKHVYEVKNNPMSGITLPAWVEVLWKHASDIEWGTYWLRLIFLTCMACLNSLLAVIEWVFFNKKIAETTINPRPIFILGHPRTGTTHLHTLLALDTSQFGVPSTFHVGFPSSFLFTHRFAWAMAGILDKTRPMDNVALTFDSPQEDELATNVLTAGTSPYMPIVLMRQEPMFRRFFSFARATQHETSKQSTW